MNTNKMTEVFFTLPFSIRYHLYFLQIRQKFKGNSRFFFGKNTVMGVALGRDATSEKADGLHKVSQLLKGQCGLMFTNEGKKNVIK